MALDDDDYLDDLSDEEFDAFVDAQLEELEGELDDDDDDDQAEALEPAPPPDPDGSIAAKAAGKMIVRRADLRSMAWMRENQGAYAKAVKADNVHYIGPEV